MRVMNDSELIAHLGGPAKLAERLGYVKEGGVQRVQNWISRGIPAQVKIDFQEIFLNQSSNTASPAPTPHQAVVTEAA